MMLKIDWQNPIIQKEYVLKIQISDLDDFYVNASDFDKSNLFFVLLTSFHYYSSESNEIAAHLSFLISYYLFVVFTPPGSQQLAMYYIKQAIAFYPLSEYKEQLAMIQKGN